jgi:hypothetical protein
VFTGGIASADPSSQDGGRRFQFAAGEGDSQDPFDSVRPVIAGTGTCTTAPTNVGVRTTAGFVDTTPPRAALAVTETVAVSLRLNEHSVPVGPGAAAGSVGFHNPPNSSVTPAEFSPGCVPAGLSPAAATGVYSATFQFTFVPGPTVR